MPNEAFISNPSFVQKKKKKATFKIYNLHPTTHHSIYILTVIQLEKLKYYSWRELHSVLPQYLSKFISKISLSNNILQTFILHYYECSVKLWESNQELWKLLIKFWNDIESEIFYLATRTLSSSYSASKPFELLPNWQKHSARLYTVH